MMLSSSLCRMFTESLSEMPWKSFLNGTKNSPEICLASISPRKGVLQVPDASYVHAYGIATNPLEEIEALRELHGVKKGKHFCIWVDRVRIEKLSDSLYLARFDKWEKSGPRFSCAVTTALLQSKIDAVNGLQWKLIHETWLVGREGTKLSPPSQVPISEASVPEPPSPETSTPEPRTPRAPMSESFQIAVPDSSVNIVVPKSLSIVVPESLKIVVPE